jgi:predicted nucleic acid-binding protein
LGVYADTSFLVSLYTSDSNSEEAFALSSAATAIFSITPFGEAEFVNTIELRVFRKEVSSAQAERSLQDFQRDLDARSFLEQRPIPSACFEQAFLLSRRHTRLLGTRGVDILHVAIALELKTSVFYTFDRGQAKLAKRAGLPVRPGR